MKIKLTENELKQIVTKSVKRVLREGIEDIITIGSPKYGEKGFRVEIGDGGLYSRRFNVYAYDEQEALDMAVDYAESKGWKGLFWDNDESVEEYPDDFITAGNHCHSLRVDCFIVRPLKDSDKRNELNEDKSRKKREPRKGTIELNGKHIDAVEDGLDKNGNPMYKVNDPSIKGRRCKDGSIRVQHYNFKPNRVNESVEQVVNEGDFLDALSTDKMLKKASPHTQKMNAMFSDLRDILNEIGKYAEQQGIWSYSTPSSKYVKGRQHSEIKDIIQRMLLDVDTLQNTWSKHLYSADKNYKSRPEFQLP